MSVEPIDYGEVRPERHLPPAVLTAAAEAAQVPKDVVDAAVRLALADGGPNVAAPAWQRYASCRGVPIEHMYPKRGVPTAALTERCSGCAVLDACIATSLWFGEKHGVWGISTRRRRALRRVLRNAGILGVTGEDAYIAWQEDGADREPPAPVRVARRLKPWPHQAAAVDAAVAALADGGRAQIAVATASGKTHIGLWVGERLGVETVLVLVPNLALVAQTADLWTETATQVPDMLAVCSDTGELALEATTDPYRVREFMQVSAKPALVFGTYQSSSVLAEAGVEFDLVIADEAHHLAGEVDKAFATVVRGEILAKRVLYMTATPKFMSRRRRGDVEQVGMDNESVFGPRVFQFSLPEAIEAGVVADYRVMVAAVERDVFERMAAHPDLSDVDPHLLAGAIAVVKAMDELDLSSCVSFHTRVDRARNFASLVGVVAEALPGSRPSSPGWSGFVHGATSVRIRRRLLSRLADPGTWGVVANARALGEGVDMPTLDAVAIVDPKNAEADVMQATGRALRRPGKGKTIGTVILPLLLTDGGDPTDPLAGVDERSMQVVSGVLRALRAHDSDLAYRLDSARRRAATAAVRQGHDPDFGIFLQQKMAARLLRSRIELWVPGGATGEMAGALSLRLVRESTADWEEVYGRLAAFAAEQGHTRPAQSDKTVTTAEGNKFTLGQWCTRQRTLYTRGLMPPERIAALEALPGWTWNLREDAWWDKFKALKEWRELNPDGAFPARSYDIWHNGVDIGQFVNVTRGAYPLDGKDGGWIHKFPDRIAALEALPGWTWNQKEADWEANFQRLCRYVKAHGHADACSGEIVDGIDIGKWVQKQRSRIRQSSYFDSRVGRTRVEHLSPERTERLRALPGWVDHTREASWEVGYEHLVAHIKRTGSVCIHEYEEPDGFGLGRWVASQRMRWREGRISEERIARLEAIPEWNWQPGYGPRQVIHDKYRGRWQASFDQFVKWVDNHGHVCPLQSEKVGNFAIGRWVQKQRSAYAAGRMPQDRIETLESVPGWTWRLRST